MHDVVCFLESRSLHFMQVQTKSNGHSTMTDYNYTHFVQRAINVEREKRLLWKWKKVFGKQYMHKRARTHTHSVAGNGIRTNKFMFGQLRKHYNNVQLEWCKTLSSFQSLQNTTKSAKKHSIQHTNISFNSKLIGENFNYMIVFTLLAGESNVVEYFLCFYKR